MAKYTAKYLGNEIPNEAAATGHGSWRWLYADRAGVAASGPAVCFTSERGAEAWLSAQVDRLQREGISAVTLLDGERVVYGPLSLAHAA